MPLFSLTQESLKIEIKPKQGCSSSFWLSYEHIFIPYWDNHTSRTSANAEELWRGRHGRNSPVAPGARPAQTYSLLHPMRTDVPEDDPRILGTDKSRNESGRDFNPRTAGGLSHLHTVGGGADDRLPQRTRKL